MFWNNLRERKSALRIIPEHRWDYKRYYEADTDQDHERKIYCKWGGFIEGVDLFDPLLFQMTPLEAKQVSPEERLMLQTVWETVEDSGYTASSLNGQGVGVFMGITTNTYSFLASDDKSLGVLSLDAASFNLANRISYYFNFEGPSHSIDTACSSSLVAIHQACQSLRSGESNVAVAGGVNLYLHPSKYQRMCRGRLLSTKETGGIFDEKADGFIPGEGIGAVLLKPLKKAMESGDHIYGVIGGTGVSHKGKGAGYLLPSPNKQAELMNAVLNESGLSYKDIDYIEGQTIGSEMTDLAEWQGLKKVFDTGEKEASSYLLGSLKPNIGHLEAASGIAQLTKVLMQLKYNEFAPTILAQKLVKI